MPDAFRLELRGTLPGDGQAVLSLPVGKRFVSVPLVVDKGRFHAIVTVTLDKGGAGILDANLGIASTSEPSRSESRDDAKPMLLATGAAIELVRWKPVLSVDRGAEAEQRQAAEAQERQAAKEREEAQERQAATERKSLPGRIASLEKHRARALDEVQNWEQKIKKNEERVEVKRKQIAIVKRRHRFPDTSDLESDLGRQLQEISALQGRIADRQRKIDAYDAELASLRERLVELGG